MNKATTIDKEIKRLKERKEMASFQRKITTEIWTAWEYDNEIAAIDRRIEQLRYKRDSSLRSE